MSTRVLNFTFHGVGEPPPSAGEAERDVWISHAEFVSALDAICTRERVTISFDDGNASDIEIALPALRERGVAACFFVVADRIGSPGYLDAADLGELRRAGMQIGLHGMRHRPWRGLSDRELDEEVTGARALLEAAIEARVTVAACPFGSYDRRSLARLRGSGFQRVFSSDGGWASADAWLQARNTLRAGGGAAAVEELAARSRIATSGIRRTKTIVKRLR
jgi:peptidoglycan/xylan/chitin deacetylase (PgdA/CDA1 family)